MNTIALAATTALTVSSPVQEWLDRGRGLVAARELADWRLADWIAEGRQQFGEQLQFDMLEAELGLDRKQLRAASRIAEAFPIHKRAAGVSFDVHRHIAQLPEPMRLETLQRASVEHWTPKKATTVVTEYRRQQAMFEDHDPERLATLIYRAWNNASPETRRLAFALIEVAAANNFGLIDEEVAHNA